MEHAKHIGNARTQEPKVPVPGTRIQFMEMVQENHEEGPTVAIMLPDPGTSETCLSGCGEKATWIVAGPAYGMEPEYGTPCYYCEDCKDTTMAWIEDFVR